MTRRPNAEQVWMRRCDLLARGRAGRVVRNRGRPVHCQRQVCGLEGWLQACANSHKLSFVDQGMPADLEQKSMSTHPQHATQIQLQGPRFVPPTFNPHGMPKGVEFIFDRIPKPGSQPHQFDLGDVQTLTAPFPHSEGILYSARRVYDGELPPKPNSFGTIEGLESILGHSYTRSAEK